MSKLGRVIQGSPILFVPIVTMVSISSETNTLSNRSEPREISAFLFCRSERVENASPLDSADLLRKNVPINLRLSVWYVILVLRGREKGMGMDRKQEWFSPEAIAERKAEREALLAKERKAQERVERVVGWFKKVGKVA